MREQTGRFGAAAHLYAFDIELDVLSKSGPVNAEGYLCHHAHDININVIDLFVNVHNAAFSRHRQPSAVFVRVGQVVTVLLQVSDRTDAGNPEPQIRAGKYPAVGLPDP